MQQADFKWRLTEHSGRKVLLLEDLDQGSKSLTNDIKRVVSMLERERSIDPYKHMIIYKDSFGIWDGYNYLKDEIFSLGGVTLWPLAAENYVKNFILNSTQ